MAILWERGDMDILRERGNGYNMGKWGHGLLWESGDMDVLRESGDMAIIWERGTWMY